MTPYGLSVIVGESPIIRITKGTTNIYFNTIMLRFTLLMIFTECVLLYIILTCIVPLDSNHLIFTRGRSCISNPFASIFYLAIMVSEIKKKKGCDFFCNIQHTSPTGLCELCHQFASASLFRLEQMQFPGSMGPESWCSHLSKDCNREQIKKNNTQKNQ